MILHKPIMFSPFYKNVIWGGTRISEYKGIPTSDSDIGESWEISALPGRVSVVENGEYEGSTLTQLIEKFGEQLLGRRVVAKYGKRFPLLIKFIDAHHQLSVQVHPDDQLAMQRHGTLGKSELWYVIDAVPEAKIYVGFKEQLDPETFSSKVDQGTIMDSLEECESKPGDVFFLPAGRIHAIGPGNLLIEIQESSDITYRIFDYNRCNSDGKPRELHTSLAREALDFAVNDTPKSASISSQVKEEELVNCEHFTTHFHSIEKKKEISIDPESFTVIICIKGEIEIQCTDGTQKLTAGHTALIPAGEHLLQINGHGTILTTQA